MKYKTRTLRQDDIIYGHIVALVNALRIAEKSPKFMVEYQSTSFIDYKISIERLAANVRN